MKTKNISKHRKLLALLIIAFGIVIVIAVSNKIKLEHTKKEIVLGYNEVMDGVLAEYLSGTGTDRWGNTRENTYATKMDLEEIDYNIVDITVEEGLYRSSHDDTYVLNLEIYLTCSENGTTDDRQGLADEVFGTFYDIQSIVSGIKIGEYECSYYPTEYPNYAYEELITIYINDIKVRSPYYHDAQTENADNDSSVKCRRSGCGKDPVYTDWDRRYCSEHLNETHYCRYPGCMNEISNYTGSRYCYEHD